MAVANPKPQQYCATSERNESVKTDEGAVSWRRSPSAINHRDTTFTDASPAHSSQPQLVVRRAPLCSAAERRTSCRVEGPLPTSAARPAQPRVDTQPGRWLWLSAALGLSTLLAAGRQVSRRASRMRTAADRAFCWLCCLPQSADDWLRPVSAKWRLCRQDQQPIHYETCKCREGVIVNCLLRHITSDR